MVLGDCCCVILLAFRFVSRTGSSLFLFLFDWIIIGRLRLLCTIVQSRRWCLVVVFVFAQFLYITYYFCLYCSIRII